MKKFIEVKLYKSARDGQFVTERFAKLHQSTTYRDTIRKAITSSVPSSGTKK